MVHPNFFKSAKVTLCAIVNAAKDAGIDLSHNDLAKAIAAGSPNLTDEDLESVSSGTIMAAALVK
ncbi:hypothetical protein BMJ24_06295 [Sinorhizobium medicae]|nr:hypothetical protein BMJ24_06295 [Sinorhizobium medicae]